MRTLEVVLGDRSYPVHVGSGLLNRAGDLLANMIDRRAVVVTNAIVAAHHLAPVRNSLASRGVGVDVVINAAAGLLSDRLQLVVTSRQTKSLSARFRGTFLAAIWSENAFPSLARISPVRKETWNERFVP